MEVYYYCSYKGSPVGFILGKLSGVNEAEDTRMLSKNDIDPLIRECFELGMVRKAYGLLPQKPDHYFLLLKKLVTKGGGDDLDYYMNISFVTDDQKQYQEWMKMDSEVTEDTIAQAVRETILLDRESDFGYKIKSKPFANLVEKNFGSIFGKRKTTYLEDGTYFELASQKTDLDDVMRAIGITDDALMLEPLKEDGNWVSLSQKKKKSHRNLIMEILLAVYNKIKQVFLLLCKH